MLAVARMYAGDGEVHVGVNSDLSVLRLKGIGRPVNLLGDRVRVLEAIRYVDRVHVFHEDSPISLLTGLAALGTTFRYAVKGSDYADKLPPAEVSFFQKIVFVHRGTGTCVAVEGGRR